jgi:hypothetical protein
VLQRQIQALTFVAGTLGLVRPALPACDADVQKLQLAREAEKQKLVDLFKAAQGKPLDPGVFCTESTGVLTAESAVISYMEENKGRCSFRDDEINKLKARHAGNVDFNATLPSGTSSPQHSTHFSAPNSLNTAAAFSANCR